MRIWRWEIGTDHYMVALGVLLVAASTWAGSEGNHGIATTFALVGSASLLAAPFASRVGGTLKVGPVELQIRDQVITAARSAPVHSLKAILPMLESSGVSVAAVKAPQSFEHLMPKDNELGFIRQRMQLTILAIERLDRTGWIAGGQVSEEPLSADRQMLVCGPPASVDYFRMLVEADDPILWDRVR